MPQGLLWTGRRPTINYRTKNLITGLGTNSTNIQMMMALQQGEIDFYILMLCWVCKTMNKSGNQDNDAPQELPGIYKMS